MSMEVVEPFRYYTKDFDGRAKYGGTCISLHIT